MTVFYFFLFFFSFWLIYFSNQKLISSLVAISKILKFKEFVVSFLIGAFFVTFPNLFFAICSIFHKIPQLSFSEIIGGNTVDLTLGIGLTTIFSQRGLITESRVVQFSNVFVFLVAILPLLLISDGEFSRLDGIVSILFYFLYLFWLFSEKWKFKKEDFPQKEEGLLKNFSIFLVSTFLLLVASESLLKCAIFFAKNFNIPISLIGILGIGLGNSIPEISLAVTSAKKGEGWLALGGLMGAVVTPTTLVLGILGMFSPFEISNILNFATARFFLVISSVFFLFFIRTGRKLTKKEGVFLLILYFLFLISQIKTLF
jgi:cation:H+ antiporter